MTELRLLAQDGTGRAVETYTLGPGLTVIGREESADISLGHASLSRRHAGINVTDRGVVISDLGSANGVFVNGTRVATHTLADGDRIHLGQLELELRFAASRSAATVLSEVAPRPLPAPVPAPVPAPALAPAPAEDVGTSMAGKVVAVLFLVSVLAFAVAAAGWWWIGRNPRSSSAARDDASGTDDAASEVAAQPGPPDGASTGETGSGAQGELTTTPTGLDEITEQAGGYAAHTRAVAAAGLNLTAPDGLRLVIAPGVLDRDTRLEITRRSLEPEQAVTIYDIDLGGAKLGRAVDLTLPIDHPDLVAKASDVRVRSRHATRGWEELPGTLAPDRKSITVHPDHFSEVEKEEPWLWATNWAEVDQPTPKILDVPYEFQDQTKWCWAASATMVAGAHGKSIPLFEFVHPFGVDTQAAWVGEAKLIAQMSTLGFQTEYKWWWTETGLAGYLAGQIDRGRPVWVGLPSIGHAVAVVGYSNDHVYVHDPSGTLIAETIGGISRQTSPHPKLGRARIPWDQWDAIASGSLAHQLSKGRWRELGLSDKIPIGDVFPNATMVVTGPAASPRALSMQLLPEGASLNGKHHRREFWSRVSDPPITFMWDATKSEGWTFDHSIPRRPADDEGERLWCNNDTLLHLRTLVSNTSGAPISAKLTVTLDDEALPPLAFVAAPATLRTVDAPIPAPLRDLTQPLAPGPHILDIAVEGPGGIADRTRLEFLVAPGMVPGVTATRSGNEVSIRWEAAVDESVAPRLEYRVYRAPDSGVANRQLLGSTSAKSRHLEIELADHEREQKLFYSVWIYDPTSGLESLDAGSFPAEAAPAPKPKPAPNPHDIVIPDDLPRPPMPDDNCILGMCPDD